MAAAPAVDAIAIVANALKKGHRNDIPIQRINRNHHQTKVHAVVQNRVIIHQAIANERNDQRYHRLMMQMVTEKNPLFGVEFL